MKNVIDCLMGGISYWAIGHGLCVGRVRLFHDDDDDDLHMVMTVMMMVVIMVIFQEYWSNPFFGWGDFFLTAEGLQTGPVYGTFIFLVFTIFYFFSSH